MAVTRENKKFILGEGFITTGFSRSKCLKAYKVSMRYESVIRKSRPAKVMEIMGEGQKNLKRGTTHPEADATLFFGPLPRGIFD
jgi:hypothetical protein